MVNNLERKDKGSDSGRIIPFVVRDPQTKDRPSMEEALSAWENIKFGRWEEPESDEFDSSRRDFIVASGALIAAFLTGYGLLRAGRRKEDNKPAAVNGNEQESINSDSFPRLVAKVENHSGLPQLRATVEEARKVPSLRAVVFQTAPDPELHARLVETQKAQKLVQFEYPTVVETIVRSVYQPEVFYLADGKTVNPNLEKVLAFFANYPNPSIQKQAKDLAAFYLGKMNSAVTDFGDLQLALRMADLAARLDPESIPLATDGVQRAVDLQKQQLNSRAFFPEVRPDSQRQPQPNPKSEEIKVTVDERLLEAPANDTSKIPSSLAPFLSPGFLFTPYTLAAYVHSQLNIARGLGGNGKEIVWKAISCESLIDKTIKVIESSELLDGLSKKLNTAMPDELKIVLALPGEVLNAIQVAKFEQESCGPNSPCGGYSLSFGNLVIPGQSYRIITLGEIAGEGIKTVVQMTS